MMSKGKVLVAMSGGVDSSVAAALLSREYDAVGVTLKLFTNEDIALDRAKTCCSLDDVRDARSAAFKLGMEHYVFNFGERFRECVINRFNNAYINGDTPNPCIDCNRFIKFDALLKRAEIMECDYIATGHYVRRKYDEKSGRYLLKKGKDCRKDQSYVLYALTQEQLSRTLFPVGEYTKDETRGIAAEYGLLNAGKPDSQDICFVPDGDYAAFIERDTGMTFPPGDFIDLSGNILGKHNGIIRYTVGQRRGLNISLGKPAYVIAKNIKNNTVTLGGNEDLFSTELIADDVNLISIETLDEPMRVTAKTRYSQTEKPATVYPLENGQVRVVFDEPQRAITSGQAVVFYSGDTVVGGGSIRRAAPAGKTRSRFSPCGEKLRH